MDGLNMSMLNPANVNPKYYEGLGFIEQTATTTTRAVEIGLPLSKISVNSQGKAGCESFCW